MVVIVQCFNSIEIFDSLMIYNLIHNLQVYEYPCKIGLTWFHLNA